MWKSPPRWVCLGRLVFWVGLSSFIWGVHGTDSEAGRVWGLSGSSFEARPVEGDWQQSSVTALLQSRDGYLWLGTYHGLVRYDGVSFTVFDSGNTPGLPNGRITSLHESPDGTLWTGHETGQITRITGGQFQSVSLGTNWPGGAVQAIATDQQNDLWLLSDSGILFRVTDGRTVTPPIRGSHPTQTTLAHTKNGKLWIAAHGSVATLEGGVLVPVVFPGDQPGEFYERVFAAQDGGVWVLGGGLLRKWLDGRWVTKIEGFPRGIGAVSTLGESRAGLLVGTSREGLYLLRSGAEPIHFNRADGLSHDWVRALCVDQEGVCWIGTGAGLDVLRPRKVQMLAPADHWQGFADLSFVMRADGTLWVGTEGAGLYRYDGQRWTVFGSAAGLRNLFVWSVLETKDRELFVGTWGGGLYRLNGDHFDSPGDLGKITAPVAALYQGLGGELWIGTQEGLYRYEGGKLVWFAGKEQLALPDVRAITQSADGTLWFGMSGGGLGRLRDGGLKQFRKEDGLGSDLVSCLYAEADGTLWIGTTDNGLTRLARGKFSVISESQGLPSRILCHLVDDGIGHLWVGSRSGILCLSKADLHRCANGEADLVHCLSYGRPEGLSAPTCCGEFQPGACRTADGRLWFPTAKGLAIVDPAKVTTNSIPPPVVIEALFLDGSRTNWLRKPEGSSLGLGHSITRAAGSASAPQHDLVFSEAASRLRILPGHRRFEFHYTALSFAAPDKVGFRRKLEGLDHDWVDVGAKRLAEYSYLPPGDFVFRVVACNNDGVWNERGASIAFTVLPFFWQTLWFRALFLAGGAASIAATVLWLARRRLRRKLELVERQRVIERERSRIARDIHDDLGASLTRISLLSETIRGEIQGPPEIVSEVEQIRSIARESTRTMDEIVWAVNPQYDTLDSLVAYLGRYAERYLSTAAIRCRLDVPVDPPSWVLNAEVRHNVFLTFKEALHNVVKHAHATEVRISVELSPSGFTVLITDNGRGFLWNPAAPTQRSETGKARTPSGNGLFNMRKRMEEIGSACTWESTPGEGTRTKLSVVSRLRSSPLPGSGIASSTDPVSSKL